MSYLFLDGYLFEINDEAIQIIKFCEQAPEVEKTDKHFSGKSLFSYMIREKVIVKQNDKYEVAGGVKIFDNQFFLTAVSFYFGFQCNLNCRHCHSRLLAKEKKERMSPANAKYIVKQIIAANPLSVRIGGGEPLMRDDFLETVDTLTSAGIITGFTTNGWFMDDVIVKTLTDFPNLDPIRLSIHGFGQSHDAFTRVNGSFNQLLKAQTLIKKAEIPHKFVVVVSSETKDKIGDFISFAENVGANGILFRALKLSGNANSAQMIGPDEWQRIYSLITKRANCSKIKVEFAPSGPPVNTYLGMDEKCLCGRNMLTIRPSGDFSACGILFKKIGNVFHDNLKNFWETHPEFWSIRNGPCPCETIG